MKKTVLFSAMIAVLSSLSFANSVWHFKSGSRNVGNNEFTSVVVHNKTGGVLEVEGDLLNNDSEALFQKDSIVISCKEKNSKKMQAVYSLNGDQLEVTVGLGQRVAAPKQGRMMIVVGHHHHAPCVMPPRPHQSHHAKPARPGHPHNARPRPPRPDQPPQARPSKPEQHKTRPAKPEQPKAERPAPKERPTPPKK